VEEGDTLGAIAEKTGVPVETIELLNPEVDPQALIAGQKLQLRE
jgi:LysM repeat protein